MIAAEHPTAKLTQIGEPYLSGYYEGCVDVQVEIPGMATFKMAAVAPQKFELERFMLELDMDQEKKKKLCQLIEDYGSHCWNEGSDSERESQSY